MRRCRSIVARRRVPAWPPSLESAPLDLLRRYDRPGPRYTSYPTAVEFHDGFRRTGLSRAPGRGRASGGRPAVAVHPPAVLPRAVLVLRVHGHHHEEARGRGALPRVPRRARRRMLADALGARRRVVQYHWGGGTPTYLTLAEMEALHDDGSAALRRAARRRGRHRSGPAGHQRRAAGAAAAARIQPRVVRRAGLHARSAGGRQPHSARGAHAPPLRRCPRGSASTRSTST